MFRINKKKPIDVIKVTKKMLNKLYKNSENVPFEKTEKFFGFSSEEYNKALEYAENHGYIKHFKSPSEYAVSQSTSMEIKTKGIDFLREENIKTIREIHSWAMVLASIVLAIVTFIGLVT